MTGKTDGQLGFSHVFGIARVGVLLVGGDVQDLASGDGNILVILGVASPYLWALGVEGNGNLATRASLFGSTSIINDRLVVLVAAVGEVHADNIETSFTELVDGLDRVCLGSYGADNGGSAVVLLRLERGIERGQPGDSPAALEMVESCGHCDYERRL